MDVSGNGGLRGAAGNLTICLDWLAAAFRQRSGKQSPLLSWLETAACVIVFSLFIFFYESQLYRGHWRCYTFSTVCTFTIIILGV